jgi:hypothetical protein
MAKAADKGSRKVEKAETAAKAAKSAANSEQIGNEFHNHCRAENREVSILLHGKTIQKKTGEKLTRDRRDQAVEKKTLDDRRKAFSNWLKKYDRALRGLRPVAAVEENSAENRQANNDDEEIEIVDMTVGCKWITAISKSSTAV